MIYSRVIFGVLCGVGSTSAFAPSSAATAAAAKAIACRTPLDLTSMTMTSTTSSDIDTTLDYVSGVSSLPEYDTYLLDMWGVMHDGSKPYDGVLETIAHLKAQNKRLVILSNSSKRLSYAHKMLKKLGFNIDDFEQIITSGEVSWRMMSGDDSLSCNVWPVLTDLIENSSKRVFLFGSGDNDEEYCETAGWSLAPIEEADMILARGTFTLNDGNGIVSKKTDGEEAYFAAHDKVLQVAADRKIPMLVANPDRVRPDEGFPPMPGAIGDCYERALAGDNEKNAAISEMDLVRRIGKPHSEVYELALSRKVGDASNFDSSVLMVGDALETDIIGGKASAVESLWVVTDGIHSEAVEAAGGYENGGPEEILKGFNEKKGYTSGDLVRPTHVVSNFKL
mmetsp:Transcript_20222/g.58008  ORF Transcript_20222/g.58008 Transcript_20222/m.58008 type:complete len:394 (-) Transcript_20222:40-1221(-)